MSRAFRLFMLVSVASLSGACSQSPTGPTSPTQPTAHAPKQAPLKASGDDTCDWTNPWVRC
jgi:hypothetical protein